MAETTILRRFGIDAPAPVATQYTYTGMRVPFEVQKRTVEMLTTESRAYVLSGMGVGKTACPIWAFDFLKMTKQATRMLVIAPLSTLDFTWMAEFTKIGSPLRATVLHGAREKRLKRLAEDFDVYIINHDGVKVIYDELQKRKDIDTIVIDELAVFRNANDRTKMVTKLCAGRKWVWGMTGSPTPNEPTDVFQQAKIVTPDRVPKYFTRFREDLMYKISQFKWVPRPNATESAFQVLQPAVRYTLEDVGELPGYISRVIDVPLGVKQSAVYDKIKRHCCDIINGHEISAANQGVLLNKLLQISLGYVYTNNKGVVALDNKPRVDALLDILEATNCPVLVFLPFKHALQGYAEHIRKHDKNWEVAVVSGDTPAGQRSIIFNDFQNNNRYKAIVAHPQCLAHGITLTSADTVVWVGPIASLEIYDQANARIRRTGQTKKQQFIHLQGTQVEKKMYRMVIDKQNVQKQLLQLFEDD